ncbi:GlxA family transcriptional regulator [Chitinophaga sp. 22321]|uniref:Helix-turn-helix domain-containing protein n=1 Tax=Chitinophaga hostae TaxID=2831022 RepID=A0ABS5J9T2_9BACT|nr:helix-turn-helix domain-containing protein [Chitinophaga hostae]MBS0031367.1 helix-turn-helix domain-containing protein [Chitinophaga hostae]
MKHLTIIVPDGQSTLSSVACIVGAHEMFATANAYWKENGRDELFKIELAGISEESEFQDGMLSLKHLSPVSTVRKTDLILVPALVHDFQGARPGNKLLAEWIAKQYRNGAEVASMCTGAYMLASSGLLDGRKCSTHWHTMNNFRTVFPNVILEEENLITDEKGIYTNGGGYSFLNLAIYLVEKYYDRQTAIYCSKILQVEIDRQRQSAFIIFTGQKLHDDEMVKEAQLYIESKPDEKISVEDLSSKFAVGRRNFDRRFIKATGNTPVEYAQRVKIEWAKKAFENTRKTINEVMYEVGYSDVKAFRELFRKITGMSPLEYRNKYNKEAS